MPHKRTNTLRCKNKKQKEQNFLLQSSAKFCLCCFCVCLSVWWRQISFVFRTIWKVPLCRFAEVGNFVFARNIPRAKKNPLKALLYLSFWRVCQNNICFLCCVLLRSQEATIILTEVVSWCFA